MIAEHSKGCEMEKRRGRPPRGAVAVMLATAALAACGPAPHDALRGTLPTVTVQVQPVEPHARLAVEEVVGTVRAKLRSSVEAKVSGRIEQMLAQPGQTVKGGDLLAQLESVELQARLESARAVREQAEADLRRAKTLVEGSAISRAEFDSMQARARVSAASLQEAETMLGHSRVVAPFAGVVTRKLADVGDLALPGKALLELEDPGALRLEANIPESLIGKLALGQKLEVRASAQDAAVVGVVSEIAPIADPASRTFLAKLDLPAGSGMRSGQFARVAVPIGESRALEVPVTAVVQRGQMEMVFVETNRVAQLRLVKTGKRTGDRVELISGLEQGERVVTAGSAMLRDGQPVDVRP